MEFARQRCSAWMIRTPRAHRHRRRCGCRNPHQGQRGAGHAVDQPQHRVHAPGARRTGLDRPVADRGDHPGGSVAAGVRPVPRAGQRPSEVGVPGHLANLRDRNEVLFYRLLTESHLRNAAGCLHPDRRRTIERFSHEFRRPHGVYLSVDHPEDVETALRNTGLEQGEGNPIGLAEVVARTQPTILIGMSTHAGAFTEAIVLDMAGRAHRPADHHAAVNPASKCEALPDDLIAWTDSRVLTATGSAFGPVTYRAGRTRSRSRTTRWSSRASV
jgi:Malic enzyme, NAD binding domain